jgi:hypothetical protein
MSSKDWNPFLKAIAFGVFALFFALILLGLAYQSLQHLMK